MGPAECGAHGKRMLPARTCRAAPSCSSLKVAAGAAAAEMVEEEALEDEGGPPPDVQRQQPAAAAQAPKQQAAPAPKPAPAKTSGGGEARHLCSNHGPHSAGQLAPGSQRSSLNCIRPLLHTALQVARRAARRRCQGSRGS